MVDQRSKRGLGVGHVVGLIELASRELKRLFRAVERQICKCRVLQSACINTSLVIPVAADIRKRIVDRAEPSGVNRCDLLPQELLFQILALLECLLY